MCEKLDIKAAVLGLMEKKKIWPNGQIVWLIKVDDYGVYMRSNGYANTISLHCSKVYAAPWEPPYISIAMLSGDRRKWIMNRDLEQVFENWTKDKAVALCLERINYAVFQK